MLYFIKSGNYYKIGFSDNIEKRISCYMTHNPDFELIGLKEGDEEEELQYHEKYYDYCFVQSEWMQLDDI